MKQNNNFQFVIHRDNFLSKTQCDNIVKLFDDNKSSNSELVGEYKGSLLNKNVRDAKEIIFEDDYIKSKIKMVLELANLSIYKYNIQELEDVKLLKYNIGGKYQWHTDVGSKETSTRKNY